MIDSANILGWLLLPTLLAVVVIVWRRQRRTPMIDPHDAALLHDQSSTLLLDVRSISDYQHCHIAGAYWAQTTHESAAHYDHCICYGSTTTEAHDWLRHHRMQGAQVWVLSGGLQAWKAAKLPLDTHTDGA